MAGSTYGTNFTITTWGESHGAAIGVVVDGCPAGLSLTEEDIQSFLDRRKPGQGKFTTARKVTKPASSPVSLKAEQPELRFQFSSQTKISVPMIMEISKTAIVRDMQTIPLIPNMVFAIIGAVGALPEEKRSDASLPGLLLPRSLQSLAFTSKRTPAQSEISKFRLLNIVWKKYQKMLCICRAMPMPQRPLLT